MVEVVWTGEAFRCLDEIEDFIAQDSPENAIRFSEYLLDRADSLLDNPQLGRIVPEFLHPDIREIIAKGYRIVYRIREQRIEILSVFEGHRLLDSESMGIDFIDPPED